MVCPCHGVCFGTVWLLPWAAAGVLETTEQTSWGENMSHSRKRSYLLGGDIHCCGCLHMHAPCTGSALVTWLWAGWAWSAGPHGLTPLARTEQPGGAAGQHGLLHAVGGTECKLCAAAPGRLSERSQHTLPSQHVRRNVILCVSARDDQLGLWAELVSDADHCLDDCTRVVSPDRVQWVGPNFGVLPLLPSLGAW